MTISAEAPLRSPTYLGDGVTTTFAFPFAATREEEAEVFLNGVLQANGYTVALNPNFIGGSVTFAVAPASGVTVDIVDQPVLSQDRDYTNQSGVYPDDVEKSLDKHTRALRRQDYELRRSLRLPVGSDLDRVVVPGADGQVAAWDADGNLFPGPTISDILAVEGQVTEAQEAAAAAAAANTLAQTARGGAETARTGAETALTQAQALARLSFPDLPALLADTGTGIAAGTVVDVRSSPISYEVTSGTAQLTTAGGTKLLERGPVFSTRERLAAAVTRGALPQGSTVEVEGIQYTVDSSATGMASGLYSLGVNGVRVETPTNVYLGTFFKTDDIRPDLYTTQSPDALVQVNSAPIMRGNGQQLVGFDPSLFWDRELRRFSLHVFQGGGPADVTEYRSKDLLTWEAHYRNLGPAMIRSETTPVAGGTVPASNVWWMGLHEEKAGANAGELYGVTIIRTFADFVDINGRTVPNMQLYTSRVNDRDALTFDAPVRMNFGNNTARVGFFPVWDGAKWVGFLKNDYNKNIECWHANTLTGAWTYQYTLDYTQDVEGCCVVPEYYYAASSTTLQRRWALLTDAYWSGNYWHKASTDLVNWTTEKMVASASNIRHGNLYNFGHEPEAVKIIERALAFYGTGSAGRPRTWVELSEGLNSIHPREDVTYFVTGTTFAQVDIIFPAAKRPRFVVKSDNPIAGISLLQGDFFVARDGTSEIIGCGITSRSAIELDYDGLVYTVPALERRGTKAVALSTQPGFPSFTETWKPQHRTLYFTDGSATYAAETVINNLPGNSGLDGVEVCFIVNSGVANGTIRIKATGANIAIGASDFVISAANGNTNRVHTLRRVNGLWRLLA